MIYYCVKTSEYLADILDKVSRETQYYFQLDVPLDRAESIIEKFQKRYDLNQTKKLPVEAKTSGGSDCFTQSKSAQN